MLDLLHVGSRCIVSGPIGLRRARQGVRVWRQCWERERSAGGVSWKRGKVREARMGVHGEGIP